MAKKFFNGVKEFLGIEEIHDNLEGVEIEETPLETEKETKIKESKPFKKELDIDKGILEASEKNVDEDESNEPFQTVFFDPKNFSDCKKIARYIKNDQMITLNLEYLDTETAQRMMDFLMGAMLIKGATFLEINKKVYTAVPKNSKVHYAGKKDLNEKTYRNDM
ncbi:MAG: cell division protein SepF [Fusobacteriaceae bacterium]